MEEAVAYLTLKNLFTYITSIQDEKIEPIAWNWKTHLEKLVIFIDDICEGIPTKPTDTAEYEIVDWQKVDEEFEENGIYRKMEKETEKNEKIWNQLAKNGVLCSQPKLELTAEEAKQYINKNGFYEDDLKGKNVLCLACGGGQQSIGFALLGAHVTVVDFSSEQLEKDKLVAQAYGKLIKIIKSDMRDLSFSKDAAFDIV